MDHTGVIAPVVASLVLIALFVVHALRATAPAFGHTYWALFAVTAAALAPALLLARVESRLHARTVADSTPEPVGV